MGVNVAARQRATKAVVNRCAIDGAKVELPGLCHACFSVSVPIGGAYTELVNVVGGGEVSYLDLAVKANSGPQIVGLKVEIDGVMVFDKESENIPTNASVAFGLLAAGTQIFVTGSALYSMGAVQTLKFNKRLRVLAKTTGATAGQCVMRYSLKGE